MSRQTHVTRAILAWEHALVSAEAGCAALAPASKRAALVIGNSLVLNEKTRRILGEAVESSVRLAAETQESALYALHLDARAKFYDLLGRIRSASSAPFSETVTSRAHAGRAIVGTSRARDRFGHP